MSVCLHPVLYPVRFVFTISVIELLNRALSLTLASDFLIARLKAFCDFVDDRSAKRFEDKDALLDVLLSLERVFWMMPCPLLLTRAVQVQLI